MRCLSASELVEVWERCLDQHPVERALTLLGACSGEGWDDLAALAIGERDARLLAVFERLFGPVLNAFVECPRCAERLEYSVSTQALVLSSETPVDEEGLTLKSGEWTMSLRLPNSVDLSVASRCPDVSTARRLLVERCVVQASQGERQWPVRALPDSALEQAAARLTHLDPQADMVIDLECAACGNHWQAVLDIESFLWVKIGSLAKRLLREVHVLARAYGWRESEILGLSAARRQFYLEMVGP
jgi:hypothetical protein